MDDAAQMTVEVASPLRQAADAHRQAQTVLAHLGLLAMEACSSEDAARRLVQQYGSAEKALNYLACAQAGIGRVLTSWSLEVRHVSPAGVTVNVNNAKS